MNGVGIDLLEIDRLERALTRRPRLAERLFTDSERAYADSRARPAMPLAARFCAKEAVAKALSLREWSWRDIEVVGGGDAPPEVRLAGTAAERARELGIEVKVSLTHTAGMAVVAVDDLSGGFVENVPDGATWREGDLRDVAFVESLWEDGRFDYVYHLGAYAAEGLSHFIRRYNYETNLVASVNLINEAILHEAKR